MKNSKYKILVLSDLTDFSIELLKSTVALAEKINGNIEFFHVKKPMDIVERDSQLSTFRTINEQHTLTKKTIKDLLDSVYKTYNQKIEFSYSFGNIKTEIGDYITKKNPDIIVLGKRKSRSINFLGDNIAEFVLKTHKGMVMIANHEDVLEPNKNLSLGVFNSEPRLIEKEFPKDLFVNITGPLKVFSFAEKVNHTDREELSSDLKTVEYVFEHSDNTIQNLSSYLSKSNVNLLLVDRNNNNEQQGNSKQLDIKSVVNKLNVSLLISGNTINTI